MCRKIAEDSGGLVVVGVDDEWIHESNISSFLKSSASDFNMNYFRKEMNITRCRLNHWFVIPAKYPKLQISVMRSDRDSDFKFAIAD